MADSGMGSIAVVALAAGIGYLLLSKMGTTENQIPTGSGGSGLGGLSFSFPQFGGGSSGGFGGYMPDFSGLNQNFSNAMQSLNLQNLQNQNFQESVGAAFKQQGTQLSDFLSGNKSFLDQLKIPKVPDLTGGSSSVVEKVKSLIPKIPTIESPFSGLGKDIGTGVGNVIVTPISMYYDFFYNVGNEIGRNIKGFVETIPKAAAVPALAALGPPGWIALTTPSLGFGAGTPPQRTVWDQQSGSRSTPMVPSQIRDGMAGYSGSGSRGGGGYNFGFTPANQPNAPTSGQGGSWQGIASSNAGTIWQYGGPGGPTVTSPTAPAYTPAR